ncbi:MAG TPA: GNAT family N-acetyltransferase [Bradyrhizobium sp.]|nr:GNAT family N-acetyltransferase [Bradyrhizobium sp.]
MRQDEITGPTLATGRVRTLRQEELTLLRDHLLRLDRASRCDRFHGFVDDDFLERYARKCGDDGTVIIGYLEDGMVRAAAELHALGQSSDSSPEVAFSVEAPVRRRGVGSILFRTLIAEALARGYRSLTITTGSQNQAMRALANKFGADLSFRDGGSAGTIDLTKHHPPEAARTSAANMFAAARAITNLNRAYWEMLLRMYGWGRTA